MWDNFKREVLLDEELMEKNNIQEGAEIKDILHIIGTLFEQKLRAQLDYEMYLY
jgi:hypothetical protein